MAGDVNAGASGSGVSISKGNPGSGGDTESMIRMHLYGSNRNIINSSGAMAEIAAIGREPLMRGQVRSMAVGLRAPGRVQRGCIPVIGICRIPVTAGAGKGPGRPPHR